VSVSQVNVGIRHSARDSPGVSRQDPVWTGPVALTVYAGHVVIHRWSVTRIPRRAQQDMIGDLRRDLEAATDSGVSTSDLTNTDPLVFADRVAH
jgi:hypothetical protein